METSVKFGKVIRELPPTPGNPRNSEGAFLTLPGGDILFVYSRFKGASFADSASADIWMLRSRDGGHTFGEDREILTCEGEQSVNIMSLSLLPMQNGDLGLFYLIRATNSLMRMYLRRSSDEGVTWSPRVLCTPQEGFFVVNNDRVTRLANGRIIIPAAIHRKGWRELPGEEGPGYFDARSDSMFFYSDNDGSSWKPSADKCCMAYTSYCMSGLQEPGVVELSPSVLWGWARTDLGRQYEMYSMDGGTHWTAPQPCRFTSPNSPLCMKRGPDGRLYAVWNPIPVYNGRSEEVNGVWTGGRTPLVIAASGDNGKSFSPPLAFEGEEDAGYCYCAIHFTQEALLLAYCAGGREDGVCLARTRLRRVPLEELEAI